MSEKLSFSKEAEEESAPIPVVSAQKAGQVGQMMEGLAKAYMAAHPGQSARWVYAPLHRGELSNVMSRRAQGYKPILVKDIGPIDGFEPDEQVRVADCILMGIPKEVQMNMARVKQERADAQLGQVEQEYYETIKSSDGGQRMRPSGRAVIEERDRDYEIKQREE